jgi:ferritin-like metal-binding protein YciE
MSMESFSDLYTEQLQDVYSAETQLVEALPKMAKAASNKDLKKAFEMHLEETQQHVQHLEQIFETMDAKAKGKKFKGMEGLIKEGEEMTKETGDKDVIDAGLIAAAQRVEHYEIAAYGTLCTYAEMIGDSKSLKLLKQILGQEKAADEKLSQLAVGTINERAKSN